MPKKGVVAFDFDGEIGDSVKECFVQAMKAHQEMGGRLRPEKWVEKKFREGRPFVTVVENFSTVLQLIEQNPKIQFNRLTQTEFNAVHRQNPQASTFAKRFYDHRKQMQTREPREWRDLQREFPRIARLVRGLQKKNEVFIASTKDKKSVQDLLTTYGIRIPENRILSRDFSADKNAQLAEIAKRAGVHPHEIILVEDSLEQLQNARKIGVSGVMARWGYSTKAQKREARKENIPIIRRGLMGTIARMKIKRLQRRIRK